MIFLALAAVAIVAGVLGHWLGRRQAVLPVVLEPERRPEPNPTDVRERVDIERAMADLRLGVVVMLDDGTEVYRNNRAVQFATGRHGDALVEAALQRVMEGALVGLSLEETVEVYGPPARTLTVQASPTYDGGELGGAVGVIDDVTEARHIDRVRSDFVANVSHELRTPVGAMSVLAETIAGSDDPEVIDRLAGRMQREANRLANTIDDLLALSRLESGPVTDPETIDLVSVATMAVERTGEAAQQRQVLVTIDQATDGPILIDGDQGQLVSAVANLVENAIKYSDDGGEVTIRLDTADDAKTVHDIGMAEISVVDEGIGIPERDLDRIFERFYRVDSARSRETGGSGLGLSIVRHALQNHRADIGVKSTEGVGSTFTVRIPLSAAQAQLAGWDGVGGEVSAGGGDGGENRR